MTIARFTHSAVEVIRFNPPVSPNVITHAAIEVIRYGSVSATLTHIVVEVIGSDPQLTPKESSFFLVM